MWINGSNKQNWVNQVFWYPHVHVTSECSEDDLLLVNSKNASEHIIVGDLVLKKEEDYKIIKPAKIYQSWDPSFLYI